MKKILFGTLVLLGNVCSGQITHEHTYTNKPVNRVNLAHSGEKYFSFDKDNSQVKLYNSDHTHWKTINLPISFNETLEHFGHLSENKINADNLIEIIYSYSYDNGGTTSYGNKIINENGNILLTIPQSFSVALTEFDGMGSKLVTHDLFQTTSKVYNLPSLSLDHTYPNNTVFRVNLPYSGEKYYSFDKGNNQVKLYNANHSLWKTINLPISFNETLEHFGHLSEDLINTDNLIEIIYSYSYDNGGTTSYGNKIINENGNILLTIPESFNVALTDFDGLGIKLVTNDLFQTTSKVYNLPSLSLDHTYPNNTVNRVNLPHSGEKYYSFDKTNNQVKLYNANHSLWKTINLPISSNETLEHFGHLSEDLINTDNLIEIIYSYSYDNGGTTSYGNKIINENGNVLLTISQSFGVRVSNIKNLPNKLITYDLYQTVGKVYGLESTGTFIWEGKQNNAKIKIYPNPCSDRLNISSDFDLEADMIRIFSIKGELISEVPYVEDFSIDISSFEKGVYLLVISKNNKDLSYSKFIVN